MPKLFFASSNPGKILEINALLPRDYELITLKDVSFEQEIPETAHTFKGNALLKAEYSFDHFGLDCFADDSGLVVEALHGAPGVLSARYAGEDKSARANIQKVLKNLEGEKNRRAYFITVIALKLKDSETFFEGIVHGQITHKEIGNHGFGYDPIFIPDGQQKTFAEMEPNEKAAISHRAIALAKLIAFLTK